MYIIVLLFFLHASLANFVIGFTLANKRQIPTRLFGFGLISIALSCSVWTLLALMPSTNAKFISTYASLFFLLGMYLFYLSGIHRLTEKTTFLFAGILGSLVTITLFMLRTFVYHSYVTVSPSGLIIFNLHPVIKICYLLFFSFATFPAIDQLREIHSQKNAGVLRASFFSLAISALLLLSSNEPAVLLLSGIGITFSYLILWLSLLAHHKA